MINADIDANHMQSGAKPTDIREFDQRISGLGQSIVPRINQSDIGTTVRRGVREHLIDIVWIWIKIPIADLYALPFRISDSGRLPILRNQKVWSQSNDFDTGNLGKVLARGLRFQSQRST